MAVVTCKACGQPFDRVGNEIYCPRCREEDEKYYEKIREYLRVNSKASAFVIMEKFGISTSRLKRYLKEGLLTILEEDNNFLKCEGCDASIQTGRFCRKCAAVLQRELNREITPCTYVDPSLVKEKVKYLVFR